MSQRHTHALAVTAVDECVDRCIYALERTQQRGCVLHLVDAAGLQNSAGMRGARPSYAAREDVDLVEYFHRLLPETLDETASTIFVVKDRAQPAGGHRRCVRRAWEYTEEAVPYTSGLQRDVLVYLCEYQNVHLPPDGQHPSRCRNENDRTALHALCQVDDLVLQHIVGFAAGRIIERGLVQRIQIMIHSANSVYGRLSGAEWQDPLWAYIPPPLLCIVRWSQPRGREFDLDRRSLAAFFLTSDEREAAHELREAGLLRYERFPFDASVLADTDSFRTRPWQMVEVLGGTRSPLPPAARSELLRAHLQDRRVGA